MQSCVPPAASELASRRVNLRLVLYEQTFDLGRPRRLQWLVLLQLHLGYDRPASGQHRGRSRLQSARPRDFRKARLRRPWRDTMLSLLYLVWLYVRKLKPAYRGHALSRPEMRRWRRYPVDLPVRVIVPHGDGG